MKRVLWVNPSFLDYRIPLYQELYKALHEEFYLVYSKFQIPLRCEKKIHSAINDHAISVRAEKIINFKRNGYANQGMRICFSRGLYQSIASAHPDRDYDLYDMYCLY